MDAARAVSVEERAELNRIREEGRAKKLSIGTVRVYVLTPDGHPHEMISTENNEATLAGLKRAVAYFKPSPGGPVVPPKPQAGPPHVPSGAIALHLVSRADERGSWGDIPAENWIVLIREDWTKLLPAGDVAPGRTWELDREVSARILTYFYPQTENNDTTIDRIEQQSLSAKVLSVDGGAVTARIDGFVRMHHVFYPGRKDAQPLLARVVGVMRFSPGGPPLLQLATTDAVHGARSFRVAVQTVQPPGR